MFSDFRVHNPASGTHYRVAIRGQAPGQNFCTCPDYATNNLGTCKYIEFTAEGEGWNGLSSDGRRGPGRRRAAPRRPAAPSGGSGHTQ